MRFLFEFIHGSLDLFSEIIRVLNHLENLLIVLLQHHPGYLGSTRIEDRAGYLLGWSFRSVTTT